MNNCGKAILYIFLSQSKHSIVQSGRSFCYEFTWWKNEFFIGLLKIISTIYSVLVQYVSHIGTQIILVKSHNDNNVTKEEILVTIYFFKCN